MSTRPPIARRHGCTLGARRADERRYVPHLCDRVLAPKLNRDVVVILDSLSSHKPPAVCAAIESIGVTLLFLPPYSPDFNPIEQAFSKPKGICAKPLSEPFMALWNAIGRILDLYSPQEYANHFAA